MAKTERIVWKIGKKRPSLKLIWTKGAALTLSKQGFDAPDENRFWAFVVHLLWACCQNKGKMSPEQFAEILPDDDAEVMQVFLKLIKQGPWKEMAPAIERHLSGDDSEDDDIVIGGEQEEDKPEGKSESTPSAKKVS